MNEMTSETQSTGGESLFAVIAVATIAIVALESGFIALAKWWALPCIMLTVIAATGIVIYAVMRTVDGPGAP